MHKRGIDLLNESLGQPFDWRRVPVVVPITTGLSVIGPDDVIGVGVATLDSPLCDWVVIQGRDWEATAQYTGITADYYQRAAMDEHDASLRIRQLLEEWPVCVSFADRLVTNACLALKIRSRSVPLGNLVRWVEMAQPVKRRDPEDGQEEKPVTYDQVLIAAAKTPSRVLGRADLLRRCQVNVDTIGERPEMPAMGVALLRDQALWGRILEMPVGLTGIS